MGWKITPSPGTIRNHFSPPDSLAEKFLSRLLPWLVPVLLIVTWQICADAKVINTRLVSSPLAVLSSLARLTIDGTLWRNIKVSCFRSGAGFFIGGSVGLVLGFLTATFKPLEILFDSSLQMFRTIPHLALAPLVIIWFGIGEEAKIFLIFCGVMFPIYLNTFHGIRSVDRQLINMARVYGLKRFGLWRQVIFPGALPSILVGVRFSLGIMWTTLIVAETIAASSGIGYMATNARELMQTDVMILSILVYAFLGKLADILARKLEQVTLSWKPEYVKAVL